MPSNAVTGLFLTFVLLGGSTAFAERPTAPYLLPADTLAYVRVASTPELIERFRETAMGRIAADQQVQPLVSDLYRSAVEAFQQVEDRVGLPLDELLRIPQGELSVAVVAPGESDPQVVVLIEVGEQISAAHKVIDRAETELAAQGADRLTEMVGETELVIYRLPGERQRRLVRFEREGLICLASAEEAARQVLAAWDGEKVETLAENRRFTSIMKRSVGFRDESPQITWYADPIAFAKRVTRGNFSAQAGISIMTALGLDGLKGIGGSMILATEEFDGIFHTHFLIEHPRDGILKMLALKSSEITPEPWVPRDAASYMTLNWDVEQTRAELIELYNTFRGEDAWQIEVLDRVADRADVDLEQDVIQALEGRVTIVAWIERPARINSQANLIAFRLKDADRFRKTLNRAASRFEDRLQRKTYGGVEYFLTEPIVRQRRNRENSELVRQPAPCVAVLDDYLIATDSEQFLERVIVTKGDASQSLAEELDFKLITNKLERQLGDTKAGMISFSRPEEGMRLLYELATARSVQERLAAGAEDNRFFEVLDGALKKNPLPPFAVLARYLAPGGALITDDETGFHYTAFNLRRD